MVDWCLRWAVNCSGWIPNRLEWPRAMACIQLEETERIRGFMFSRDAKLALVGRLLIRAALVHLLDLPNDEIHLGRTDKGKPYLLNALPQDTSVHFNISHHGKYVVLATDSTPVGVDVMELVRPRVQSAPEFFHTMRRQFTGAEWNTIRTPSTEMGQLAQFYRHWCLKESYIKADGTGLSYGLEKLNFEVDQAWPPPAGCVITGSKLFINGVYASEWQFEESLVDSEHCVAVTSLRSSLCPHPIAFIERTVPQLLLPLRPLRDPQESEWDRFSAQLSNHPWDPPPLTGWTGEAKSKITNGSS